MDLVLASNQFTPKEICIINYFRMHLQAVTLADLCLADGVSLDPAFYPATLLSPVALHNGFTSIKLGRQHPAGDYGDGHALCRVINRNYIFLLALGYYRVIN